LLVGIPFSCVHFAPGDTHDHSDHSFLLRP
jgi:hypothetical protein